MSETLQYLTDEDGKKTAVVLPITDYEKLLEDLDDLAAIAEWREEPTIPHEQFKAELKRDGILLAGEPAIIAYAKHPLPGPRGGRA
jgi:hypothetical protein